LWWHLEFSIGARVLIDLLSPMSLVIAPMGIADFLIIETVDPDSRRTQKSLRLLTSPIASAVQMIIGDSCFGITFGPLQTENYFSSPLHSSVTGDYRPWIL
jgi:hypothetical protein